MKIAVNDANIFIDLFEVDLVREFFELKLELHTTDLVINELDFSQRQALKKFTQLSIKSFDENELKELSQLELASGKLSAQDLSVYYYAKAINATILTGDKKLRTEAKKKGFEVHGIIWVFDQLIKQKIIKKKSAIEKLNKLMTVNTWLPMDECKKRIEEWRKKK